MGSGQLYEVELKSKALLREGKKGLITYFRGGRRKRIASNIRVLYPQYTAPADDPIVNITPITERQYAKRKETGDIVQKQQMVFKRTDPE